MKTFSDFGNGLGIIYVTEPDGTSIVNNLPNTTDGSREAKSKAVQAAAASGNLISNGSVTFTGVAGVGNVTQILVGGVQQLSGSVSVTALNDTTLATAVAANINAHKPAGIDYTAVGIGPTLYIFSTSADGSGSNGSVVAFTTDDPGNVTATTVDFSGGADADKIYDEAHGFRFFLDADYLASSTSCSGDGNAEEGDLSKAIEITTDIILIIASPKSDSQTIADGAISPTRQGSVTYLEIDTEGGAGADVLTDINMKGFAEGDLLYIRGANSARITTMNETGDIDLEGGTTFLTGGYGKVILLQLWAKGGGADVLTWFEVTRSPQKVASVADYRTDSFPFTSQEGSATLAASVGGTTTLTANVSKKALLISGASSLTSNFIVELSTTGAVAGDLFYILYEAQITIGAFQVRIGGATPYVLTEKQALIGGWLMMAYYTGTVWVVIPIPNSGTVDFKLESAFILNEAITTEKLAATNRDEWMPVSVSFDTDEIGDHKITMSYAGTIISIKYAVNKLIEVTNAGSIVAKNNALVVMATTSIAGGSAVGTIISAVDPSANNTFVAGDVITFTSSKATAGGKVNASLKITRA